MLLAQRGGLAGPCRWHVPSRDLGSGQTQGRALRDRPPLHHQAGQGLPSPGLTAAPHSRQKGVGGRPTVSEDSGSPLMRAVVLPREHMHHKHTFACTWCSQLSPQRLAQPGAPDEGIPLSASLYLDTDGKHEPQTDVRSSVTVLKSGPLWSQISVQNLALPTSEEGL